MALAMQAAATELILIGILDLPADQVGVIQALIGIPGIGVNADGGASADQKDARRLLVQIYLIAPILPLFLLLMEQWQC
ncbi:MAG: hypothetical protein CM15mP120_01500 [Pseudomonadota bacterium]|nr:MAG: hypothetical protein CM15mP120_01500 [Pseudomonadota bacterium]